MDWDSNDPFMVWDSEPLGYVVARPHSKGQRGQSVCCAAVTMHVPVHPGPSVLGSVQPLRQKSPMSLLKHRRAHVTSPCLFFSGRDGGDLDCSDRPGFLISTTNPHPSHHGSNDTTLLWKTKTLDLFRYCSIGEANKAVLLDLCAEKETPSGERVSNRSSAVLEQAPEALPDCLCVLFSPKLFHAIVGHCSSGSGEGGSEEEPWSVGVDMGQFPSDGFSSYSQPSLGILGLLNIRYKSLKLFIAVFI